MKAAVDSSVLIALGKLGYLKLVGEIFDKLVVAESVLEEIRGDEVCTVVSELTGAGLVEVANGSNYELLNLLSFSLGKGEAETIVVALGLEADVGCLMI